MDSHPVDSAYRTVSDGPIRRSRHPASLAADFALPLALVVLIVVVSLQSDTFLTYANVQNVMRQSAVIAIAAIGLTLVLVSGGIDISQGAVMAVSGVVLAQSIGAGHPEVIAIVLLFVFGGAVGAVNGFFAEVVRVPPLIATLGFALVVRGIGFVWTGGRSAAIPLSDNSVLRWIGRGEVFGIPAPFFVACVAAVLAHVALKRTVWGRHTFAVGGNPEAARAAGIGVRRHRWMLYVIGAMASALAGLVLAARLGSAAPNAVATAEFDVITAAVLGGVSIYGGVGRPGRVLLAAVFLAALSNGLVQLNVPAFWERVVTGSVFLVALSIDRLRTVAAGAE